MRARQGRQSVPKDVPPALCCRPTDLALDTYRAAGYGQTTVSGTLSPPPSPGGAALRQRVLVGVVGLLIVLVAAWLALIVVSRIDELFFPGQGIRGLPDLPLVEQGEDSIKGQINILVMGLDRRPAEGDRPTRTDTMFVVTIDAASKTAGILGIPRDLWVEIPTPDGEGFFEARINTAYQTGELGDYSGGGPRLVKDVVERNIGIEIDHYVLIDFDGFIEMIDELGGIDVFVEEEINDPFYSETEIFGDYHPLHFEVGMHHMDGQTALDYSRTRFGNSDFDRIRRQQQVIFAAIDKAVEQRLLSLDQLTSLWRRYKDTIKTDINDIRAPGFAALAAQIDREDIAALSLGVATQGWTTPQGAAVLLIDKGMVQQLVQALFGDRMLSQEAALVEVQDAAGTDGLAAQAVAFLVEVGFSPDALTAANSGDGVRPLTEIIDFSGNKHTVELLAGLLDVPAGQVRSALPEDSGLATAADTDVLVILGADADAADFVTDGSAIDAGGS